MWLAKVVILGNVFGNFIWNSKKKRSNYTSLLLVVLPLLLSLFGDCRDWRELEEVEEEAGDEADEEPVVATGAGKNGNWLPANLASEYRRLR